MPPRSGGWLARLGGITQSLKNRNYRLFFVGQGISLIGTWMSRLATTWLVYRLGGREQPWLLGLVGFLGFVPVFFLGPFSGVFNDRWNRHRTLLVTQVFSLLQSAALAWVAFANPSSGAIWLVG